MEEKSAEVEGMSVQWIDFRARWIEHGTGIPLVLIHGFPTGPSLWRDVMPRIVGARCIAWEMVGYGASMAESRDQDISLARQADYLALTLKHLGIERAVLAGHDLGGGVAQIAAIRYPEICAGLLLANAVAYDDPPVPNISILRGLVGTLRYLPNPPFRAVFRSLLRQGHDSYERAKASFDTYWPHYARNGGVASFRRQLAALDPRDMLAISDRIARVEVPARLVWGVGDASRSIEIGERLARDLGAPLRRIEGAKHFTPEDHPEIIAEEINGLLAKVRGTSQS